MSNRRRPPIPLLAAALLAAGVVGTALAHEAAAPPAAAAQSSQPADRAAHDAQHRTGDREVHRRAEPADRSMTPRERAGLEAARAGTGASAVAAEKAEHMPVPQTGM